jgi:hypothetical protein
MKKTLASMIVLGILLAGCATAGPVSTPTLRDTGTPTPSLSPSSTPSGEPRVREHASEEPGVRFQYPSRFSLREYPEEQAIAIELTHEQATIYVMSGLRFGPSIKDESDSTIDFFCTELPPCEVLEREEATLGGERGERLLIQYTDHGVQKVRFSVLANHNGAGYAVWLITTLSEFGGYRADAELVMGSLQFLSDTARPEQ